MQNIFEIKENYFDVDRVLFSSLETMGGVIYLTREANILNIKKTAFVELKSNIKFYFVDRNYSTCAFFHVGSNFFGNEILIQSCSGNGRSIASSYVENTENNLQQTNYTTIIQTKILNDCLYMHSLGNIHFNHINCSSLSGVYSLAPHAGYAPYALYQTYNHLTNLTGDGLYNHFSIQNKETVNHIVFTKNHPINSLAKCESLVTISNSIFFGNDLNVLINIKVVNCQYDKDFGSAASEGCIKINECNEEYMQAAPLNIIDLSKRTKRICSIFYNNYSFLSINRLLLLVLIVI